MELFSKLGIDWRLLVMQIINFAVLLYILKRFLYKPVLDVLERRREQVKKDLETTEQIKKEFAAFEEQKAQTLTSARQEAQSLLDGALKRANEIEVKAGEDATMKAADILERAKRVISEEKEKIVEEAKKEVVGVVLLATEKLLGKKMEGKEAEEFIKKQL